MNLRQKLKFVFALSLFSASVVLASSPVKSSLPTSTFTLDRGESISEALNAPITITNNTVVSSTFSVMLMDDVLDGGLSGATITDNHVGKTWIVQSSSATNTGSGIDLELLWDASEEVGAISSYEVVAYDEQSGSWERLNGTLGSVQTSGTTKTLSISGVTEDFTTPVMLAVAPVPAPPAPTVTSISPKSGSVGSSVTITGTGFNTTSSNNIVTFDGVRATIISATSTQIVVTVPYGTTGNSIIRILNTATGIQTAKDRFVTEFHNAGFGNSSYTSNAFFSYIGFSGSTTWQTTQDLKSIVLCSDFNADGFPDYASIGNNSTTIKVFENQTANAGDVISSSTFGSGISLTVSSNPRAIYAADINSDGLEDLVVLNGTSIDCFINTSSNGTMSFASKQTITVSNGVYRVRFVDYDQDGMLDMFTANSNAIYYLRNTSLLANSSISFTLATTTTAPSNLYDFDIADYNSDSYFDIISTFSSGYAISLGSSSGFGSFTSTSLSFSNGYGHILSLDFDKDGDIDIVIKNNSTTLLALKNLGAASFSASTATIGNSTGHFKGLITANFNGDSFGDVSGANANSSTLLDIFTNTSTTGNLSFANSTAPYSTYNPMGLYSADLNGDGRPDFIHPGYYNSNFYVLQNRIGLPSITTYSTTSGSSGSSVSINGLYFTGATAVTVGGTPVTSFTVDSDTKITAVLGSGSTGQFSVTTPGGTATGSQTFTFSPGITVTGSLNPFTKCNGSSSSSQSLTVTGSNLNSNLVLPTNIHIEYSIDNGVNWAYTYSLVPVSGNVSETVLIRARSTQNTSVSTTSFNVTSSGATSVSVPYSIVVNDLTSIAVQPTDDDVCINSSATVSVSASGSSLTYQWYSNTVNSTTGGTSLGTSNGAQSASYSPATSSAGTTYYYVEVQGTCGSITSNVVEFKVSPNAIAGTASTSSSTYCSGSAFPTLTLTGNTGDIQWQESSDGTTWSDIVGANSSSYTFTSLTDSKDYRAKVTSGGCTVVYSNDVTISVPAAPYPYDRTVHFYNGGYLYSSPTTTLNLSGTGNLTVEAWIYPTDFTQSSAGIVSKGNAFSLKTESNGVISFIIEQSWSWEKLASPASTVIANKWQHVAATYNSSTRVMKLYVDGSLVGSYTRTQGFNPDFTSGNLQIGRNISGNGGSSRNFHGNIDEIKIWNTDKSAADIAAGRSTQLTGNETNLAAYYKFDEGIGGGDNTSLTSMTDYSQNGNDLSIQTLTMNGSTNNIIQTGPAIFGDAAICESETQILTHTYSGGSWSSSDQTVATVSSGGLLTAVSDGSTTISYAYTLNGCNYTSTKAITVNALPAAPVVSDLDVCNGEVVDLSTVSTALASHSLSWMKPELENTIKTNDQIVGINYPIGQSFTPTTSMSVGSISVDIATVHAAANLTMSIHSGDGITGSVLASTTKNVSSTGEVVFEFATPVSLTANQVYTFNIETDAHGPTSGTHQISYNLSGDIYTGGQFWRYGSALTDADLWFKIKSVTNSAPNYTSTSAGATTYAVYQTNDATGCASPVATQVVTVNALPATPVVSNVTACIGSAVDLSTSASSLSSHTLSWSTGGSAASTTAPSFTPSNEGTSTYLVYQTDDVTGCVSSAANQTITTPAAPRLFNQDLSFDGVDDKVSVPHTTDHNFTTGYTLEAWVKVNSNLTWGYQRFGVVTKTQWSSAGLGFGLDIEYGKPRIFGGQGYSNWGGAQSTTNLAIGQWVHLAGTYDGTAFKLYVDGQLVKTQNSTTGFSSNTRPLTIGSWPAENKFFDGEIDEVRVWSIARTQAEIQSTMNQELTGNETSLVSYYNFNEGNPSLTNTSVTTLPDVTSGSNDGTLTGFALSGTSSNWVASGPMIIGESEVCEGSTMTLTHTESGGTWSTSDANVISITSAGEITGVAAGTATISYDYTFNGCNYTSTKAITVNDSPVISGNTGVGAGEDITLSATTTAASSNAWMSSDNTVATVSSTGVVTGQAPGNATITYTNSNGCTDDYAMTVNVGTTQAPTLTSPASNITGATTFAVTYSLPETPLSGSVKLTFSPTDGSTPIVWTMSDATNVNFNYDVNTTPSNTAIVSGALIPYDTYDVELSYQDAYSNPAATVTNTNIQTLAPPVISYAPASYAYLTNSAIAAITPSNTGGAITSYAIVGTLPAGLNFSTTTGQITGTPTALQTLTTYSVTATNASGSNTTTLEIVVDVDTDGDGIPDASDVDVDGDGVPDNGTDTDGDGINNDFDDDIDGDGIPNDQDNDIDGDGIPNDEDVDVNGDGTNDNGTDTDGDGVNDANDPDIDGDGIPNGSDSCPTIINTDITVQPSTQSEDICPSLTLTDLEVTAVGENLTYQWYSNSTSSTTGGTAVSGATSATFTPPALVGPTYYYVVVSGDCGVETSTISGALYARDVINPTVTALSSYTVQLDASGAYTVTEADIITAKSDNCTAVPVITLANNVFACSDLTATGLSVSWTATDDEGNTTTGTVPVTVVDQIAPTMAVQNVSVQMDASGNSSVSVNQVDNGTTDNCAATLSFDAAGSITTINYTASDLGANNVTLYGTDASGNQSSLSAVVTVVDQISPVVNTQNVTVYLDANGAASITTADIDNGTTDNSGVFTLSLDVTSFDCDDLGTNTVVLTATDGSGNVSNANATVTVVDNITPVMNITNSYAQLGPDGTVTLTQSDISGTVVDNCDVTWTFSTATFDCTMLGANIITVTAADAAGNSATDEIVVTIVDNSAPVVATQAASLTLDANGVATLDTTDVIDYIRENCSVSTITVSQTSFNCSDLGANVVTLLVLDSEGNSTAKTATVTVTDAIAPTAVAQDITLALDANGAASINYLDVEDGSSDNCSIDSYSIDNGTFSCSDLGVNWVVLTVADASGNTDTAWAKVTVVDQVAPTVLVQPATVALDGTGAATLAAADVDAGSYDNCSGVTLAVDVTSFTCADLGANTVTLTATDAAGNTTSVATTVTVVDNSAPVVATVGDTLYLDNMGAATLDTADVITSMSDNCGIGSVTLSEYNFGCSDLGSNTVDVTVTDANGNVSTSQVTVLVLDTITPSIIMPSMMTVYANATCSATATWSTQVLDNCSATWSSNYASGSTFNAGTHFVVTTAQDASGNSVVDTMILSVVDTISPIWTQQPFVVSVVPGGSCGAYVTWVTPMALDWCSAVAITSNYTNGSLFNSGTHTVIFTATDDNQNSSTISLTFTVNDGIAPVVNVPSTVFAVNDPGLCGAMVTLPTPTATDNCGIDTVYYDIPSGSFFSVGVTQVTITAVDDDGNTAQGVFNVEVSDVEAPTFTTVPNDTILGSCQNAFAYAMPTASDNCGVASVSLISGIASGNSFPTGTNTNVFEVIDIHGNSDTVSFTVTVLPQTVAPIPQYGPICANSGAFDLTGGDAGFIFWGDNVDGNYFNPYGAGAGSATIYYSYTDSLGCSQSASTSIFVNQSPDNPIIQRLSSTFLTVHKAYAKYQWYYNGVAIAGATSQTYNATQGGNYKVRVWNTAGCTEISSPFFVGTIGIEDITIDDINIYPNPTSGQFTIDVKGLTEDVTVMVYDALGKHISTTTIEGGSAKAIDISNEAQGLYQVVIRDANGASITKRISLQK